MTVSHILEDFGAFAQGVAVEMTDVLLEENRLEAFEKGYQAGWDDSARSAAESKDHISASFTQSLADLSFTYEEAYTGALKGLHPLIEQILSAVLPKAAHQTLGLRLTEILDDLIAQHGRQPVQLHVHQDAKEAIQEMLASNVSLPFEVFEDSSLIEGQIRLKFGAVSEQEIDLPGLIHSISEAIDGFFIAETPDKHKDFAR